jgi:hypothetical protein
LSPDAVLAVAKPFFGGRLAPAQESTRRLSFRGSLGKVTVSARPEGGHYTFIEVDTDQVGESELDKLVKRFLAEVHRRSSRRTSCAARTSRPVGLRTRRARPTPRAAARSPQRR